MFKKVRKQIVAVLLCVLCLGMMPVTIADASQNFKSDVKKSVVVVAVAFEDTYGNMMTFGYGTGWFVGEQGKNPEYLVTNHHVIETFLDYGKGELVTLYAEDGSAISGRAKVLVFYSSREYEEAYIVQSDDVKDLALLRLNAPTSMKQPLQLSNVTEDMVGSSVFVVGYPGIADNIFNSAVSQWGEEGVSVYSGIISRLVTVTGTGCRLIQTDADIQQGDSGGPMVNADGYVVGINVSYVTGMDTGERVHYAVNVADLIPMLNQNGVAYEMGGETPSNDDDAANDDSTANSDSTANGDNTTNGGVVSNEGNATNSDSINTGMTNNTQMTVKEEENDNTLLIAIVAVALIVVVGVVVVVIVLKKNKKPSTPEINIPPTAPVTRKAVIRSMSSQHNGMTIPLTSGQEILIGRNAGMCRMVFQDNTPGVSSRHCSLVWDSNANSFVLTDLQSTYGTYLANGQPLSPGVPQYLHAGDCFYLGDKANMLRVEVE